MGLAISYSKREKIVQRKEQGESSESISIDFKVSKSVVNKIYSNYKKSGESSFQTNYKNCGRKKKYGEEVWEAVKEIRTKNQGAYYVYSKLVQQGKFEEIPSPRTLQRAWLLEGTGNPKGSPPKEKKVE